METALEKVRELLRPDGGDIILAEDGANDRTSANDSTSSTSTSDPADASAAGSTPAGTSETTSANGGMAGSMANPTALKLQLIVENSDCPECILPVDMLEPIALDIMSADLPGLTSVSISDPRVSDEIPAESSRHV